MSQVVSRIILDAGYARQAHFASILTFLSVPEHTEDMHRQSLALCSEAGVSTGAAQVQIWLEALKTTP